MRRGREEELTTNLRDGAIHQAVSPEDVECERELFREHADRLKADVCCRGFEHELATLPGVIYLALNLSPAA